MEQLKDLASVIGINRISTKDTKASGDMYFAHIRNFNTTNGTVDWNNCLKIQTNHPAIKTIVEEGDIIIVVLGDRCGQMFKYSESTPFVTGQSCVIIKSKVPNLFERLINKQDEINVLITGAVIKLIPIKSIREFVV
jgi:hypothetical protein